MANTALNDIINPHRGWRNWYAHEIYDGTVIEGRFVPNPNDMVTDYLQGFFRITEVDYTTGLSQRVKIFNIPSGETFTDEDLLLGVFPGLPRESQLIYLDDTTSPRTLSFDGRLKMAGSKVAYVKVILGADIKNGEVISRLFNNNGELLSENIPMEAIRETADGIIAAKTPGVGHCSKSLPDGELVSAVFYNAAGDVQSVCQLLVVNTKYIRRLNESVLYVRGIELESPHLSQSDLRTLNTPINLPMNSITMKGVVTYSNGSKVSLPIDGTKFYLMGLHNTVSTQLGMKRPFTLCYRLGNNEVAAYTTENPNVMYEPYVAQTTPVDGAYSVKLFGYPDWLDGLNGYRMRYWLYNLLRNTYYEVTGDVELTPNSPAFEPMQFGFRQNLKVAIDLSKVSSEFSAHRHVQDVYVTLRSFATELNTNWTVGFDLNETDYGNNVWADVRVINQNLWHVDIKAGATSEQEWLDKLYYKTKPIYDETAEVEPLHPTHFKLVLGTHVQTYPISMWDTTFNISSNSPNGRNLYLHFFRRTGVEDLQLAVAALPTHHL